MWRDILSGWEQIMKPSSDIMLNLVALAYKPLDGYTPSTSTPSTVLEYIGRGLGLRIVAVPCDGSGLGMPTNMVPCKKL